ncbi:MAG: mrdB [Parcubacteria group bacterium]|nr:mrdB [Parcubacteria group bacterium]
MFSALRHFFRDTLSVDWMMFIPALLISLAGLVTMNSFSGDSHYFSHQVIWLSISVVVFFAATSMDWRFLRRTRVLVPMYLGTALLLLLLFVLGHVANGARSWFSLGGFAFQPSDFAKVVVILMLAKYFSRRHIEIRNLRHIIVSGVYAFIIFILIALEPDFGGAVIIFGIWFGMVLVSGISKKHLFSVLALGTIVVAILWGFVFAQYQKDRIKTFLHPLADIHGAGYNAYQSTIAVGSGQILGKGIGYGTQSKLLFLPEYQTDFIFAAFAEEWGFIGSVLLLILCMALLFRIIDNSRNAATNFEALFGLGLAVLYTIHIVIHAGMNMGFLPVTGITFPFMSYGGSHLVIEWLSLGVLSGMKRYSTAPKFEMIG